MIVDSHSHLNHESFISHIDDYITAACDNGVTAFLCVGWDYQSSLNAVKIAQQHENVYASIGIHPSDIKTMKPSDFEEIEKLINNPKVIAIGEVGLDYYWEKDKNEQAKQQEYLIKFIDLANKYNLPLVIHSRDATNATYEILKTHPVKCAGVMHCYAAGKGYVKKYVDLGFYFGVGGTVTYKNALNVKEAVQAMPLDRILVESDAPYLTPVPHRGEPNHSKYIPHTIKVIADLKLETEENIAKITTNNFQKIFRVKHFEK